MVVGVSFEAGLSGVIERIMATFDTLVISWAGLVLKVTIIVWLNCLVLVECLAKEWL
jgi:hypothetical protein